MKLKIIFTAWGLAILIVMIFSFALPSLGARSQFGMPGIYNNTAISLSNGEGGALAVDSSGHLVMSTTSPISVAFSSTATTTIPYILQASKDSGTSTVAIGSSTTTNGGCLILGGGSASQSLYVFLVNKGSHLELTTSTKASDCY